MGKLGLPSISKLEEVFDLITNLEKYTQYLSDLKATHDAAKQALGLIETKEQADNLLSDALDAKRRAFIEIEAMEAEASRKLTAAEEDRQAAHNLMVTWDSKVQVGLEDLEHGKQAVSKARQGIDQEKAAFADYLKEMKAGLLVEKSAIEKDRAKVTELKARFERANQALEG